MSPDLVRNPSPNRAAPSRLASASTARVRGNRPAGRTVGYRLGTVSVLWLNTAGPAATTSATASRSPMKSGVSTSTPTPGFSRRMARMVLAKCAGAAVRQVVPVDRGEHREAQAQGRHPPGGLLGLQGVQGQRAGRCGWSRSRRPGCRCRP